MLGRAVTLAPPCFLNRANEICSTLIRVTSPENGEMKESDEGEGQGHPAIGLRKRECFSRQDDFQPRQPSGRKISSCYICAVDFEF